MDENPQSSDDHPLSEKQSNTEETKLSTTVAALTDPKFPLPVLDEKTSILRHVLSFATLSALLGTGIVGAWFCGLTILQTNHPVVLLGGAFVAALLALFLTGTVWIDWFELVLGYWWLSLPIGAMAGLVLVMHTEANTGIKEAA